jgi:hypothetical protein
VKHTLVFKIEVECGSPGHFLDATNPDGVGDMLREHYLDYMNQDEPVITMELLDESGVDVIPALDAVSA